MKKPHPLPPSHTFSTQQQRTCWSSSPGESTGRERACTLCTRPKTWQRGARRGTLRAHQWPGSSIAKRESRSRERCLGNIGQHALASDDSRAPSPTSTQVGCLFLYRGGCMERPRHPDGKLASLPVGAKNVCLTIENAMPNVTRLEDNIPDAAELPACLPACASGATQAGDVPSSSWRDLAVRDLGGEPWLHGLFSPKLHYIEQPTTRGFSFLSSTASSSLSLSSD